MTINPTAGTIIHRSVDNYGSLKTPLVGSVCAAFQGHHETPWTITFRPFANNVYKIAYGTIPTLAIVALLPVEYALQKVLLKKKPCITLIHSESLANCNQPISLHFSVIS